MAPSASAAARRRTLFPVPTRSLRTSLRYYAVSRVFLAALLFLSVGLGDVGRRAGMSFDERLFTWVSGVWFVLAGVFLLVINRTRRRFYAQLFTQFLTDLAMLVTLMHVAGGQRSGIGILLVAAVAAAAVLVTPRIAALFAASATLLLLLEALPASLEDTRGEHGDLLLAAMIGTACFVTAALVNRLAMRLSAQERLARARGEDLRRQLAVTRLVMSELPQGVVALEGRTGGRTMNRAAQAMLGDGDPDDGLERLLAALPDGGGEPGADGVVEIVPRDGAGASRLRVRTLQPEEGGSIRLLVLEDEREVEERARQLKLASMGRLSASIAHEIRNPLSAIRHANGLLAEQLADPLQARLARIVEDNSVRIDRIVEDVLSIARREPPRLEPIDAREFLGALLPELATVAGTDAARVVLSVECDAPIEFAPEQLRQVLANLLSNAFRYASAEPGAVRVQWREGPDQRLELRVLDDGPGLPRELLAHVFEPFFTTEVRGNGLGLYLAREICAANGATLAYEPEGGGARCAFVIRPRRCDAAGASAADGAGQ